VIFVQGGELFNLLGEYEKLSSSHAKFYAACVLSGLAHLHHLGIVYRDLKVTATPLGAFCLPKQTIERVCSLKIF
jgi:serine/threonine protein kinase